MPERARQRLRYLRDKVVEKAIEYVVQLALAGVIALLILILGLIRANVTLRIPVWLLVLIAGIIVGAFLVVVGMWKRQLAAATEESEPWALLVELDDSLLDLLPELVRNRGRARAMRKLLVEFLQDTTDLFGDDVSRAHILRPNPERRLLVPWVRYQIAADRRIRFALGGHSPPAKGIAGQTFEDKTTRLVHMLKSGEEWRAEVFKFANDAWTPDHAVYRVFDEGRLHPP
jgi:hypothetical protein